jgi:hypothetical protein
MPDGPAKWSCPNSLPKKENVQRCDEDVRAVVRTPGFGGRLFGSALRGRLLLSLQSALALPLLVLLQRLLVRQVLLLSQSPIVILQVR